MSKRTKRMVKDMWTDKGDTTKNILTDDFVFQGQKERIENRN